MDDNEIVSASSILAIDKRRRTTFSGSDSSAFVSKSATMLLMRSSGVYDSVATNAMIIDDDGSMRRQYRTPLEAHHGRLGSVERGASIRSNHLFGGRIAN
eukprot:scaffold90482_cov52-Attheya_sp.AAC.8